MNPAELHPALRQSLSATGRFTDVSDAAGVRDAQWGWAAEFLDYDDDGGLDLYAVNGFLTGPIPDDL